MHLTPLRPDSPCPSYVIDMEPIYELSKRQGQHLQQRTDFFEQILSICFQEHFVPEEHAKISEVCRNWRQIIQEIYDRWEERWAAEKSPPFFRRTLHCYRTLQISRTELFNLIYEAAWSSMRAPFFSLHGTRPRSFPDIERLFFEIADKETIEQLKSLASTRGSESKTAEFLQDLNQNSLSVKDQASRIRAWFQQNPSEILATRVFRYKDGHWGRLSPLWLTPEIAKCFNEKNWASWKHACHAESLAKIDSFRLHEIERGRPFESRLFNGIANENAALVKRYLLYAPKEKQSAISRGFTQAIQQNDLETVKVFLRTVDYSIAVKTLWQAKRQARSLGHTEIEKEIGLYLRKAIKGVVSLTLGSLFLIAVGGGFVTAVIFGDKDGQGDQRP